MKKIVVENLEKKKNSFAVIDEVTFSVSKGEIFALVGIKESGKTLVTKTMLNMALRNGGKAKVGSHDTRYGLGKDIGIFMPDQELYSDMTVINSIRYFIQLNKKFISNARVLNTLNMFGLKKHKDVPTYSLAANQKIRLKLAIATVAQPKILILDEPFLNLDDNEAHHLREILKTLAQNAEMAIFVTCKDLAGVEEICDTVAIIDNGMIISLKSYNEMRRENIGFTKICISTPCPNLTAMTIEKAFGYETNLCGQDVIVTANPDFAQIIYEELLNQNIKVYGMSKVNKSLQELFYAIINRRRGGASVFA